MRGDHAELTELEQSEARFRLALAHSGVVVFEHDEQLRYTWIYPTQFYRVEEVIGRTDIDLFGAEDGQRLMRLKEAVLQTGSSAKEEVYIVRDGRRHEFVLTVEARRDEAGKVVGLTGASTNITAAKDAQRELATAVEFRERVIGIVGHDLRNPLQAIHGWTQNLLAREITEETRKPLLRIERSARRMAEMIATLLDFADTRFNARLPVAPAPMNLVEVVGSAIDELLAAHPGREVALNVSGETRGTWDAARLCQVASNLIGNALGHGDERSAVGVTISGAEASVELAVSNEGEPIPAHEIPELFKPFRPDGKRQRPKGINRSVQRRGLGFGLYITNQIVRAHGGSIDVTSSREAGTVFTVRLPR